MKRPEGTGPGASPGVGRAGLHDDEVEQALVAAEDARAEAGAAIRERDAMAVALAAARAEADGLRAKLTAAENLLVQQRAEAAIYAEELRVANEELQASAEELLTTNEGLARTGRELEARVEARTAELAAANTLLRDITDCVPHLVWSARPGGDWRYANRRWVEHTGLSEGQSVGFGWLAVVHPEDRERVITAWHAAAGGELRVEHRLRGSDGSYRWFETRALPLRGLSREGEADGEHWFGTTTDIDDARRTEAALQESETRFRDFTETTPDVLWIIDAETGRLDYLSAAFEQLWGMPRSEVMADLGRWAATLHPDDRETVLGALPRSLQGEHLDIEYRIIRPADGALRWVRDIGFPMRDTAGRVRRIGGLARDITAAKESAAVQRRLVAELNHRVKNALAAAQSVAAQTARTAQTAEEFRAAFQARLVALARAHDLLTQEGWRGASLLDLVRRTVAPHAHDQGQAPRILVEGPEVRLRPESAIALHMALHELATNAARYGALSTPEGHVEVSWRLLPGEDGRDRLELAWQERGGPPVEPPRRRGFGSRLLERSLARQLGGEAVLGFPRTGLEYLLRAPLGASLVVER